MKTIFVTGGNGFIGKNIVEHFQNTATVLAPGHKELDLLSQEQVNKYFKDHEIDYVIHCANVGGNRKCIGLPGVVEKNTRMFVNIAENAWRVERVIHFGSGAEYDKRQPLIKVHEEDFGEHIPIDHYGWSKYLISKYIETSKNIVCLRLFGVFGKYEDYEYKFISNAILKSLFYLPIRIRQNVYFDWLYINDLMKIIPHFFGRKLGYRFYNITPGKPFDILSICQIIDACNGVSGITIDREGLNNEYSGDNSRLKRQIGDFPFTPMKVAIPDLIGYYKSILPTISRETIQCDAYTQNCNTKEN